MATAILYFSFVLLLYSQGSYGQQPLGNNQNTGVNNAIGLQQQTLQRAPNNINQIPNGGLNINLAQQPNLQQANLQQSLTVSGTKQGNLQQTLNLPPNLQSQTSIPQNNFQVTKIGFTPTAPCAGTPTAACPMQQLQNTPVNPNPSIQVQQQNIPVSNPVTSQIPNPQISMSNMAELAGLKGQQSLLSLLSPQNTIQLQQNQPVVTAIPTQNQLTDVQKQFLVRSLQGQNQQGINVIQAQPVMANVDTQPAITIQTVPAAAQTPAIVTTLGQQPAYITVQAQPLTNYLQTQTQTQTQPQTPQVVVEEEPSVMSMILSELGPQYAVNTAYPTQTTKKGSKNNLKSLIPLIINMIKEKNNCGCRNCGCPNTYQNNNFPNNMIPEPQMAQVYGGYSNQKMYGLDIEDPTARIKKNDDEELRKNDKERNSNKKIIVSQSEEDSGEDDSEYIDDEE